MRSLLACMVVVATGCTSSTIISSRPDRATASVDGQDIGETPSQWSATVWAGTTNHVRLVKPGYREGNFTIAADNWEVGRVVVSVLCFLPGLLWSTTYRPQYSFLLSPESAWPGYGAPPEGSQPQYPPQPTYPPRQQPQYQPQQPQYPPQPAYPPQQPQYQPQQPQYPPLPPPPPPPPVRVDPQSGSYDPAGLLPHR